MEYTAVIRTLGRAGEKYQILLDSLASQTIPPFEIIVYLAEGYPIPEETVGKERYVYVRKGMVAQRALEYKEVHTEYILFLDDDVYLPGNAVEKLYTGLMEHDADIISPDVFDNAGRPFKDRLLMSLSGRMHGRRDDGIWAYKIMRNGGFSYNRNPQKDVYLSQTNAGPCFMMKKKDFLSIDFKDELWMDGMKYAQGDDQVMFYKMHLRGLKQLTIFNSGIKHLDACSATADEEKVKKITYSEYYFKTVFWHRFIFLPENEWIGRIYDRLCICISMLLSLTISLIKGDLEIFRIKRTAINDAEEFIASKEYKAIPEVL